MAETFTAQIDAWVATSQQRTEAVFRESTQRVAAEAQKPVGAGGNMPIDFGFLRASLLATINQPVEHVTFRSDAPVQYDDSQIALAIAGAALGDTIYLTWTAVYARRIEYGFVGEDSLGRTYNQSPRGFARSAAAQWPQIVEQVTAEAKQRVR